MSVIEFAIILGTGYLWGYAHRYISELAKAADRRRNGGSIRSYQEWQNNGN